MFGGYGGGGSSSTYTEDSQRAVPSTGTNQTFAHGLGARPKKFGCKLVCQTAEGGNSVGDAIEISHMMVYHDNSDNKCVVWADATVVGIAIRGTPFYAISKTGAGLWQPNHANWRVVLWAEL